MSRAAVGPSGFIVVNKPSGMTSFDVIRELRKLLHIRKLGHSGVLDKPATGVLVVGANRATRLFELFNEFEKEYTGEIFLGLSTTTDDMTGGLVDCTKKPSPTLSEVEEALANYLGDVDQIPPAFSLTKLGGKELYRYALEGKQVEAKPKRVRVTKYEIMEFDPGLDPASVIYEGSALEPDAAKLGPLTRVLVRWTGVGGVYIRSIARDVGADLGTLGTLGWLQRTRVGPFKLEDSLTLEQIAGLVEDGATAADMLRPLADIAPDESRIKLDNTQLGMVKNGQPIRRFQQQLPPGAEKCGDILYGMAGESKLAALLVVGNTNQHGLVELKPGKVLA